MAGNKYTRLIAGAHTNKPKFERFVYEVTEPFARHQEAVRKLVSDFDLDVAVGNQLDAIGVRVGLPRRVNVAIAGLYFGLDESEGDWEYLDKGLWKGRFDSDAEMLEMGDALYRAALRAKIVCNHIGGTTGDAILAARKILGFFDARADSIVDGQDMTLTLNVDRRKISEFIWALLSSRVLDFAPAGVTLVLHNSGS